MKCYLCNEKIVDVVSNLKLRDQKNVYVLTCQNCGLKFCSQNINYNLDNYSEIDPGALNIDRWEKNCDKDDKRRFNFLYNVLFNKDILDYGCGPGTFLKIALPLIVIATTSNF